MKKYLFVILCLVSTILSSQDETKSSSIDIGINVTSVLSSFSGNGSFLEASDFPMSLRIKNGNKIIRFGLGLTGSNSEFFDNITFAFRESSEHEAYGRIGFELENPIDDKWIFYWGMDGIAHYKSDKVRILNAFNSLISNRVIGVGGGFLAGLKFYINEKLYVSTEATLYFLQNFNRRSESGQSDSVINTESQTFSLQPPLFIYLNYAF